MRRLTAIIAALLLGSGVMASSNALAGPSAPADRVSPTAASLAGRTERGRNFERFLERYEAANTAFLNGDPAPWLAIATANEPASIFGGFGGVGVAEVLERYHLAAGAFRPSGAQADFDYLVKAVDGRIAYTVAIERADVLYAGHTELSEQVLRVTMSSATSAVSEGSSTTTPTTWSIWSCRCRRQRRRRAGDRSIVLLWAEHRSSTKVAGDQQNSPPE